MKHNSSDNRYWEGTKTMKTEMAKNTAKERLFLSEELRLPDPLPPFPRLFRLPLLPSNCCWSACLLG